MKIKTFITIVAVSFILILATMSNILYNRWQKEKAEKERLLENQKELLKQNEAYRKITLTDAEFKESMNKRIDSLIKLAGTKPKYVTQIIERHYYHEDTTSHTVPTVPDYQDGNKVYSFRDTASCFTIGGYVRTFIASDPLVTINERKFSNESTQIGYIYRPKKFIFIAYGPWKADLKVFNTCGKEEQKVIEIIKKKRLQVKE